MAGITATYVDADTFTVDTDMTLAFVVGRRVKCDCGVDGYKYGTVESSSYAALTTTVNLVSTNDDLTSNLVAVWFGIVSPGTLGSVPEHDHDSDEGDGGILGLAGKPPSPSPILCSCGGTATAIELTTSASDSITEYVNGDVFLFKAVYSNDSAVTVDIDGIGAKAVLKMSNIGLPALIRKEISPTLWTEIIWDSVKDSFILKQSADHTFTLTHTGLAYGSDILSGRTWTSDMIGAQSANPYVRGRVGTVAATWASGDTISLRLQWTGTGGAQDETATFVATDTSVTNIAAGLVTALNANSTIMVDWWFNSVAGAMNIQYRSAVGGTPVTPTWTATATTVGDGTFTLAANSTALDTAPWQYYSRAVAGRNAEDGDAIFAMVIQSSDDSTDAISTWYGTMTCSIVDATSATSEGRITFGTADVAAGLGGTRARLCVQKGVSVWEAGAFPTGGDKGDGAFNCNNIYQANKGVIAGDATTGRVIRRSVLRVEDGTDATTLKCTLTSRWNGDAIAETNNIALDATTGNFSLSASGATLTIEAAGLQGNVVSILSAEVWGNLSTTPLNILCVATSNDIVLTFYGANDGVGKASHVLVNTGEFYVEITYLTDT